VNPDKVFQDILSAMGKISTIPLARDEQEMFMTNVMNLSEWLARGGHAPEKAPENFECWLGGTRAAMYVLRGVQRP
jgi:hypothetical protein